MEYLSSSLHDNLSCNILKLLNEAEISTVIQFLNSESKKIEKVTGLTLREVLDIRKKLLKLYSKPISAYDCYQNIISNFALIPTGIERLDILLEGGLFTGNIYEICGLPASGKTLFCLTVLKNIATKANSDIVYLDTKYDFLGTKLKQMLTNLNREEIISSMNRIQVLRVTTKSEFLKYLLFIKHSVDNGKPIKLVIIDSLPPLCFISSDQTENNAFLCYTANILHYLAKEHNMVIIVTNLITLWNEGDFKNIDVMKERISCGTYWFEMPNVRICLKKDKYNCRMTLTKAIKVIPEVNFCDVKFTDEGFV
ncbi:DNA repair protein RAD51 homolog 4-like [Diabrotica virgifera virgifera]|uniref:RecA family profile 1 domain-containing protein n=1 Tax=Diabrotica virgifera virgifera TaxID=50390 RepID=A0ABM5K242_DIAVI|nr:DNA repair protein RAD51 homolog 4-like [Diabrotica virgifera virgifera]